MNSPATSVNYTRPLPLQESVISVWFWTKELLSFRVSRPEGFEFMPGQFARLGLGQEDRIEWRAFSIVSAAHEAELEFYAVLVPGGTFSGLLKNITPGDPIWIENRSNGFMTTECFKDGRDLWMLASGTGIGPFISILQDRAIWQEYQNLVLVHGVRHANEFAYHNTLLALQKDPAFSSLPARLQLVKTVTRDPAVAVSQHCLQGRITQLLKNGNLERVTGLTLQAETSRVMLCGNPEMISDTRKILHERGLKPCRRHTAGQFLSENYW